MTLRRVPMRVGIKEVSPKRKEDRPAYVSFAIALVRDTLTRRPLGPTRTPLLCPPTSNPPAPGKRVPRLGSRSHSDFFRSSDFGLRVSPGSHPALPPPFCLREAHPLLPLRLTLHCSSIFGFRFSDLSIGPSFVLGHWTLDIPCLPAAQFEFLSAIGFRPSDFDAVTLLRGATTTAPGTYNANPEPFLPARICSLETSTLKPETPCQ